MNYLKVTARDTIYKISATVNCIHIAIYKYLFFLVFDVII